MAKFRRNPVVVEAWQFDDTDRPYPEPVTGRYIDPMGKPHYGVECDHPRDNWIAGTDFHPVVRHPDGDMIAVHGDWIVQHADGEFYIRTADIFERSYEAV